MLLVIQETIGLYDESNKISEGSDDGEGDGTLSAGFGISLGEEDEDHQHSHGEHKLDAFVEEEPGLFAVFCIEVFLQQGAIECAEDHIEVGGGHHPVVPPLIVAEKAEQYPRHQDAGDEKQCQIICASIAFQFSILNSLSFRTDDDIVVMLFTEAAGDGEFVAFTVDIGQHHFPGFKDGYDGGVPFQHGERPLL